MRPGSTTTSEPSSSTVRAVAGLSTGWRTSMRPLRTPMARACSGSPRSPDTTRGARMRSSRSTVTHMPVAADERYPVCRSGKAGRPVSSEAAASEPLRGLLGGPSGPTWRRGSWRREARLLLALDYLGHILHKPDRVGILGPLEDALDGAALDNFPLGQHGHRLGDGADQGQVVGDEQEG